MTLPIPGFDISQTVPFFRQRLDRLGQKHEFISFNGQFPGFGPDGPAAYEDDIPHVQPLEKRITRIPDAVPVKIMLDSSLSVLNIDEGRFSEIPDGHHSSRRVNLSLSTRQSLIIGILEAFQNRRGCIADTDAIGIQITPLCFQGAYLFNPFP